MIRIFVSGLTVGALCLNPVFAEPLKFIDTQAQFDPADSDFSGSLEIMLKEMDRVGISKTLIVPPPFPFRNARTYDAEAIVKTIGDKKNRFGFLGGGESLNVTILETPASEVSPEVRAQFRALRHRSHRACLGTVGRKMRRSFSRHVRLRLMGSQATDLVYGA